MQIKIRHIILLVLLSWLLSCEERFDPELKPSSQSLIVVDGMISNLPGPYTIRLSLSSQIEDPNYIPLSGFRVLIKDDQGQTEELNEMEPGEYVSSENGMQGVVGRKYKVAFTSPDGKQYESGFEELREPTSIDSVYHQVEYQFEEGLNYDIAGYRFYLSTGMAPADTTFFLWQLTSTFKYKADFKIYWVYEGYLRWVDDHDTLRVCYKTETLPDIFLFNTASLAQARLVGFPLNYVTTQTRELSERYSLFVRQFSISESAFNFWRVVKDQNVGLGNLYSKQPFQTQGNVVNLQDEQELVLGYFMVAGVSERRIFVDKPLPPVQMRYSTCQFYEGVYLDFGDISEYAEYSWPVFATRGPDGNALPSQGCMDCRQKGGVIEKPVFWID